MLLRFQIFYYLFFKRYLPQNKIALFMLPRICHVINFGFNGHEEYTLDRSNVHLSRFYLLPQFYFFYSLRNKLLRHGQGERSMIIFNNFLFFLKSSYDLDPILFLKHFFLNSFYLPYRLYTVKLSNRSYSFPGPILSEMEYQNLLIKNFGKALRRRKESGFLNKFFFELCLFIDQQPDSELVMLLEDIVRLGFENRAFVHYRWLISR